MATSSPIIQALFTQPSNVGKNQIKNSSSDEPEYPVELEGLPSDAIEDDPQDFPAPRSKTNWITLDGLSENIPSVAFCNTGDDPTGRYILATDIGGTSCLFDVHQRRAVRLFRTGFCCDRVAAEFSSCSCEGGPYAHSGWGVMWLDRRSFRRTKTWSEAGGMFCNAALADQAGSPLSMIHHYKHGIWDISDSRLEVRKSSAWYGMTSEEGIDRYGQLPLPGVKRPFHGIVDKDTSNETRAALPASPFLLISKEDVMLLQPQRGAVSELQESHTPVVGFHNPLYQHLPHGLYLLEKYDRMNMCVQVPELGVVIAASGKGRAAIFSLTQKGVAPDVTYAFRLDHIVPFTAQETARKRPWTALVGVAVGPVQGTLGQQGRARKWRLLLMYVDHSVLSYELGRPADSAIGVQALIV
ncbi:hypothetical protein H2199_005136 [Coniosporium tulheliwenetii]|uniref:Uncharacterized protein n=1 Tax=Coniosporium tulheliwenetii TaxID=3383036 RepID=A0ACC2Z3H5_9PEZI|nr:hypothetical protein H2199_005136 [Cladosporium sp. JES 115]